MKIPSKRHARGTGVFLSVAALAMSAAFANPVLEAQSSENARGVVYSTTGGGHYLVGTLDITFAFGANQKLDGNASGQFRQSVVFGGQLVEFHGVVTCVSVDSANGRAWIGGVVTQNNSEHAAFTQPRHQVGKDVWFRVLDSGEGSSEPDRSTFLGFEGDADIITSAEYCQVQPWPEGNARTSAITQGNIQVRP